jgi:predicted anti-sigma-YlaC factor YlaD
MSQRQGEAAMQCEECMALLTDYLEGTLTAQKRLALENHLRLCPDCGPHNSNFLKTIALARAAGEAAAERSALPATDALIESILKACRDIQP